MGKEDYHGSFRGTYNWTKNKVFEAIKKKFSYYLYWNLFDEPIGAGGSVKDGPGEESNRRTILKQMRLPDENRDWVGRPLVHVKEDFENYKATGKLYRLDESWAVNKVFADFRSGKLSLDANEDDVEDE